MICPIDYSRETHDPYCQLSNFVALFSDFSDACHNFSSNKATWDKSSDFVFVLLEMM